MMPRDPYVLLDEMTSGGRITLDQLFEAARDYNNALYESLTAHDSFRSPVWEFLKVAKAALFDFGFKKALLLVESWLRKKHGDVEAGWLQEFPVVSAEDARADFINGWKKARSVHGHTILDSAVHNAQARPVSLPDEFRHTDTYARFISIIFHLQQLAGDEPIFIPTRKFAGILGVSAPTISHYRDLAADDGWMGKVSDHHFSSVPGQRKATEFCVELEKLSKWLG